MPARFWSAAPAPAMQLAAYRKALEDGATEQEALREVVRFLVEATMDGC